MKKCPKCQAVVDAIAECPICGNDILDEPQSEVKIEKDKLNKWFFLHLIKRHKFAIFCTIIVLLFDIITIKSFSYWHILSLIFIVFMWLEDLFKNLTHKMASWKYSDDYIESTNRIAVYFSGIIGVFMAFIPFITPIILS